MNKIIKSILVIGCFFLPLQSHASDWSIGIQVGQSDADLGSLDEACRELLALINTAFGADCVSDTTDTALGINLSYQPFDAFGIEAGYVDLGEFNSSLDVFNGDGTSVTSSISELQASALYVAGVASLHLSDNWSLSGRLGYYELDTDIEITRNFIDPFTVDDDSDVYIGGSIDYDFSEKWTAQLRYDNFDIELVSLGMKYNF